jgi:hypothetical protein
MKDCQDNEAVRFEFEFTSYVETPNTLLLECLHFMSRSCLSGKEHGQQLKYICIISTRVIHTVLFLLTMKHGWLSLLQSAMTALGVGGVIFSSFHPLTGSSMYAY